MKPRILVLCMGVFTVAMAIAIATYPGGSYFEPKHAGYDFWQNFWCDLSRPVALNGAPNPVAPRCALVSMGALGVALVLFFDALADLAGRTTRAARSVRVLGCAGVLGIFGIAWLPSSTFPVLHGVLVTTAGPLGIVAAAGGLGIAMQRRALPRPAIGFGLATLLLALVNVVQYAREFYFDVPSSAALPALQKVVTLALLGWMLTTASAARRADVQRSPSQRG